MTAVGQTASTDSPGWTDLWIAVALTFATVLYIAAWPRDLFPADEGLFLYEAKRILKGDLIYRDFFEIITPLSLYLMAGLFWLFGVSMETARLSNAGLHAIIVLTVYFTCRRLGARPLIALLAAVGHIVIGFAALPITSAHWVGTLLTMLILLLTLGLAQPPPRGRLILLGVVCGLLIAAQQQKGVIIAAGVSLAMAVDALVEGTTGWIARTARRLAWLWAGIAVIVVPMLIVLIASAGWDNVYGALVRFPLESYPNYNRVRWWGSYRRNLPQLYSLPELTRFLPLVVPLTALRAGWAWWSSAAPHRIRQLFVSSIIAAASIASVLYFPDYTHLAIIAPIMLVLAADLSEGLLQVIERRLKVPRIVGAVAAIVLCCLAVGQTYRNVSTRRASYPYSHLTEFGRVDFRTEIEIALVDEIRTRLKEASSREIFCYTSCPGLYLTTDTENATRYQLMLPGYNPDWQMDEVIETLERETIPYVATVRIAMKRATDDPIFKYVKSHYSPVMFSPQSQLVYGLFKRNS